MTTAESIPVTVATSTPTSATTEWRVTLDPSTLEAKALMSCQIMNGGDFKPVRLNGVCYSPCPLNNSNSFSNLGDWFWDSFPGVTGWEALWDRDLPKIRGGNATSIGTNTIRVYSMISRQIEPNGNIPSPWNSGQLFTHTSFLDKCWNGGNNPVYVLVGIPMPINMFWESDYNPSSELTTFWNNVFKETVTQVGQHPAVLGFVIQNELDSQLVTYPYPHPPKTPTNLKAVEFWWSQVQHFASSAKINAPRKLVCMAVHDDPHIPATAASYMAMCTSVDYWGVNTYQPVSFDSIFNKTNGYGSLTGPALKPVILTEYGFPSTSRQDEDKPEEIYSDQKKQKKVADTLSKMLPKAFKEPLCHGVYVFEFCDEWWNQGQYSIKGKTFKPPNIYTWYGGKPVQGFPNGYWDQEGFGLYSIERGGTLKPNADPWNGPDNCPTTPIDVHTPRPSVIQAVQQAFKH